MLDNLRYTDTLQTPTEGRSHPDNRRHSALLCFSIEGLRRPSALASVDLVLCWHWLTLHSPGFQRVGFWVLEGGSLLSSFSI